MIEHIECPFCRTKVAITDGHTCPACRRDVTDRDAVQQEERIDHVYELIWQQYHSGKSLRRALDEIRRDPTLVPEEIDEAHASFLQEAQRKYLHAGQRHATLGLILLAGGLAGTAFTFFIPIPITIVFTGAIAVGIVDSLYGAYQLWHYWRYFVA